MHTCEMDLPFNALAWQLVVEWFTACRQSGGVGGDISLLSSSIAHEGRCGHGFDTAETSWQQGYAASSTYDSTHIMKRFYDHEKIRNFVARQEDAIVSSCCLAHLLPPSLSLSE